jgi:pimeloyl-ACP methyl ester carboxylesterase
MFSVLRRGRRCSVLLVVSSWLIVSAPPVGAQAPQKSEPERETQWWKGSIAAQAAAIDFVVVFRPDDAGGYAATIDIPVQGAKDLALTEVVLSATTLRFVLPPPPGAPAMAQAVFELQRDAGGKTATGQLKQHGMTIPVRMEQITADQAKAVGPPRPQTPKPPFPYVQREVSYENPVDGMQLAATLTLPSAAGPHPALLLITGSGPQDRDETLFGHKPFLVIADHLARHGIAVLRVDDRGVGGSTGSTEDATLKDCANDVIAGIKLLQKQPEIDARRIGLLGHSEGAIIAPLVASKFKGVACIVLLAGPGVPGDQLLNTQLVALARAAGQSAQRVEEQAAAHRRMLELAAEDGDESELRAAMRQLVKLQLEAGGGTADSTRLDAGTELGMKQMHAPWMRAFIKHDPREALRKLSCPVLALNGSLDLQVPAKENLPQIQQALRDGGNTDATIKELPGLNHLFQEAKTGLPTEYATIEQTIAPAVLGEITDWLRVRFKLD